MKSAKPATDLDDSEVEESVAASAVRRRAETLAAPAPPPAPPPPAKRQGVAVALQPSEAMLPRLILTLYTDLLDRLGWVVGDQVGVAWPAPGQAVLTPPAEGCRRYRLRRRGGGGEIQIGCALQWLVLPHLYATSCVHTVLADGRVRVVLPASCVGDGPPPPAVAERPAASGGPGGGGQARRTCLRCRRLFTSAGRGNRICRRCTDLNERLGSDLDVLMGVA